MVQPRALSISGTRKYQRRLICVLEFEGNLKELFELAVNELDDIADLFLVVEKVAGGLKKELKKWEFKRFYRKILYVKDVDDKGGLFRVVRNVISNLRSDDLIVFTSPDVILNKLALNFFKLYDKWSQPVAFRVKWNVYGFYFVHNNKTSLKGGLATVAYIKQRYNGNLGLLKHNKTVYSSKGVVIGDLNHFGGWQCEVCTEDVSNIFKLISNPKTMYNTAYIEELIGDGVYIDGKSSLIHANRYQEYFAPIHVLNNSFKYDFLLNNFYFKLD